MTRKMFILLQVRSKKEFPSLSKRLNRKNLAPRHFKWIWVTPHDRKAIDAPRFAWHILARCKRKQERAASPRKT
jgi:hypothetical protein